MKLLTGKEVRAELAAAIEQERKEKDIAFYLFSNPEDKSSFYYLRGVKKVLERFGIPYEEDFLDRKDVYGSLARFSRKAKEKDTVLARPLGIPEEALFLEALESLHDPDMATDENVGRLFLGNMDFLPATARSVLLVLKHYGIDLTGKKVLLIGRSRTIGLPLSALVSHENGACFQVHSRIPLKTIIQEARSSDVIFLASGKKGLLPRECFSSHPIVIDCGYHADGTGDLGFVPEEDELSAYTPVPGGIGVLTSYCLVWNSLVLYRLRQKKKASF